MIIKKNIELNGSNDMPLLTDIFYKDESRQWPVLIYAHGFNGFKDWGNFDLIAMQFATAGFFFIKFNFSHNGTNVEYPEAFVNLEAFAANNYTKQLTDLQAVCNWVCNDSNPFRPMIDKTNISLLGHSMGGGITILYASEDERIKKLVTWASVAACKTPWGDWPQEKIKTWKKEGVAFYKNGRTGQQMPMNYQLHEDYLNNEKRLDIRKAMEKITIPILICHGTEDPAVPVETAHLLNSWKPSAELFLVESDHVFGRKHPATDSKLPIATEKLIAETMRFLKTKQ